MHYSSMHYIHWRSSLPSENQHLIRYGGFGENLLTSENDGWNENTICIGDVFEIGENGARIQVTQPRQPCLKLNHRFEVADMALRAQNARMTGWHNRVLVTGWIGVGDEMRLVERVNPGWWLSRVQVFMYDERGNVEVMKEIMGLEGLGEETRGIFVSLTFLFWCRVVLMMCLCSKPGCKKVFTRTKMNAWWVARDC